METKEAATEEEEKEKEEEENMLVAKEVGVESKERGKSQR